MTCYFRHMKERFQEIGLEVTPENKREIDRLIHEYVGIEYKSCPATWGSIKERIAENEEGFMKNLQLILADYVK